MYRVHSCSEPEFLFVILLGVFYLNNEWISVVVIILWNWERFSKLFISCRCFTKEVKRSSFPMREISLKTGQSPWRSTLKTINFLCKISHWTHEFSGRSMNVFFFLQLQTIGVFHWFVNFDNKWLVSSHLLIRIETLLVKTVFPGIFENKIFL